VAAVVLMAGELLAQAPAAPAAPGAPGSALPPPPVTVAPQAGFMEWVIVAAMVALAVFVVCKSSHRN